MELPKKPKCTNCECMEFIESGIVYAPHGEGSKDDMRVIICKSCGSIVTVPTRQIYDCIEQLGDRLNEIDKKINIIIHRLNSKEND